MLNFFGVENKNVPKKIIKNNCLKDFLSKMRNG